MVTFCESCSSTCVPSYEALEQMFFTIPYVFVTSTGLFSEGFLAEVSRLVWGDSCER